MNKTLALTTIALVAVVMILGTVSPAMAGHDRGNDKSKDNNVAICHNGKTIWVSEEGAAKHLANHAGDTMGPCPP